MIKLLFLILPFVNVDSSINCVDAIVDRAFNPNFKADYFLFLPVETSKSKYGRLMISKENFRKYMIALDSSYTNNDSLKCYVKKILNQKQQLFFHEFFYTENFGEEEYTIFYTKNKFDLLVKKKQTDFLKKYLISYDEKEKYFNFNNTTPVQDFSSVYEQLFRMNFLVADGDGFIAVFRVICN